MDLFDLSAKITLDDSDYNKKVDDATNKGSSLASKLKGGLATLGKITAGAIGGTAVAIGVVGKQAVEAYSNYEQLVGGVDTLFKESSSQVQKYASEAFKTAGLSANEYMETVTSFSASLLQSLDGDTEKSAKAADMAITDMSDNANKMGTSMESIQFAYQGFAKQNYTMLDNLKLGYGGTKEEMNRLLADAEKLSGKKYNLSNLNDVYEAIHVVQTEIGITGTTAKEAESTIQGSISMTKSAWQNLITGLGDKNANIGPLIDDLVSSASSALNNLIPIINQVLKTIPVAIKKLSPVIEENLPQFLESGEKIVMALASAIIDNLPILLNSALSIVKELVDGLVQYLPTLIPVALDMIVTLINGLAEYLPILAGYIPTITNAIISAFFEVDWIEVGVNLLRGIAEGIIQAVPALLESVGDIATQIYNKVTGKRTAKVSNKVKATKKTNELLNRTTTRGLNQTINIYQPVSSPIATAKAIRNSQRVGLAGAY